MPVGEQYGAYNRGLDRFRVSVEPLLREHLEGRLNRAAFIDRLIAAFAPPRCARTACCPSHPLMPAIESPPPHRYPVPLRDRGARLDLFLKERIPRLSRARVQAAIATRVRIEGRPGTPRPASRLVPGEVVVVDWPRLDEVVPHLAIPILWHDDDILVVDKPAGLVCHPTNNRRRSSLLFRVREQENLPDLSLGHRLDRETSGVLLLVRHPAAGRALTDAFMERRVEKTYLALVHGDPAWDTFTAEGPLGPARGSRIYVKQAVDRERGRPARTQFLVRRRAGDMALVEARPESGRRHQIRVHLADAGHPVVGDKLYGPDERYYLHYIYKRFDAAMAARLGAERHLLHAAAIDFPHPRDGRRIAVRAPMPADMAKVLEPAPTCAGS